jgi:hypothetical protein
MENFVVASLILWVLEAFAVSPLANHFARRRFQTRQCLVDSTAAGTPVGVGAYILADVLVLGIAGLISGLMGLRFVGISLRAKGWPGMITFIVCSFLGYACAHFNGPTPA